MKLSNLNPIPFVSNCWQTACQNKRAIVKTVCGGAVAALAVGLFYKKNTLLNMQSAFKEVASFTYHKEVSFGGGRSKGYGECIPQYEEFKLFFSKNKFPATEEEYINKISEFYNNATSNGTDLFSSFYYGAEAVNPTPAPLKLPSNLQPEFPYDSTFVICRQTPSAQIQEISRDIAQFAKGIIFAPWN